jgi:hypothetical protein
LRGVIVTVRKVGYAYERFQDSPGQDDQQRV